MQTNKETNRELRLPPPSGQAKRSEPPRPVRPSAALAAAGATLATLDEARPVADLSTIELVREITADVTRLAQKEIELAKTELKADVKAEAMMLGGLSIAALAGLCTINLLLVTAVFGLATVLPGWAAGFIISGITLVTTAIIAWLSWSKRVRKPLERTQRTLKDDVQWTKERLV